MKVCFVITSLARKGPIIVVQDLVNNYLKVGVEVDVVYFDDIVDVCFGPSVNLIRVKFWSRFDFSNYDVVHTHLLRGDLFGALNKNSINKLISTCHSDFTFDLKLSHGVVIGSIVGELWKKIYRFFDCVVFLTKVNKDRYIGINKNEVIYNGRPKPFLVEHENELYSEKIAGKVVIGTCAYITKRKALEQLIECAKIRDNVNEVYVIVGDGPDRRSLIERVKYLNLSGKFIFVSFTPNVYNYIDSFDVFCMTSSSEGMPLSLIEAASMKTPIVSSRIKVVEEMFNGGEIGFYDFGNIKELDGALSKVLADKESYSNKVYSKYLESYTDIKMSSQYLYLYNKLVENV
ncbi:glycosyltransferase [Vibrio metschnikovii]|uniref:glycosyltransferase n=1 Tax=Vibrio metschnikovii TaxID=28172 RepID=UPI001C30F423|nr:glycosyltransferase [Vibrio metschnikovii]